MVDKMVSPELIQSAVSTSQLWDPYAAGVQAATILKERLKFPPKFLLLCTTIHYERAGFSKILDGVFSVFPETTPLIGGTFAGFSNNDGCYTRGLSLLGGFSENLEVRIGVGYNTKRNPVAAAKQCARGLNFPSVEGSTAIIEIVSGPTIPEFPILKRVRVLNNNFLGSLFSLFSGVFLRLFQNGVGREEEILDELSKLLPTSYILGASTVDRNELISNYQFFGKRVLTNTVVCLALKSSRPCKVFSSLGLQKTSSRFSVTGITGDRRIITNLNDGPARSVFLKEIRWPLNYLDDRLYRRTFHYTLGYERDGKVFPEVIGAVYGESLWCGHKVRSNELVGLVSSGSTLMGCIDENLHAQSPASTLTLVVSCASRLETLGRKVYATREKLKTHFGNAPFLLVYAGGEATYSPGETPAHTNYKFNSLVFS